MTGLDVLRINGQQVVTWRTFYRLRKCATDLNGIVAFDRRVPVRLAPAPVVTDSRGGYGFGAWDHEKWTIWIGGVRPPDVPLDDWLDSLPETLAHEVVHYEQSRDGRRLTERGVAVRSRNLLRQAGW